MTVLSRSSGFQETPLSTSASEVMNMDRFTVDNCSTDYGIATDRLVQFLGLAAEPDR